MPALSQSIAIAETRSTPRRGPSRGLDAMFRTCSYAAALLVLLVLAGILGSILYGGWPAFREFGFGFLTSSAWNIGTEQYGALVAVIGTLASAVIA
ncbi:MAG: phosphate ABC transporter permease subunit PstC, partial [Methylobacterium sp.]